MLENNKLISLEDAKEMRKKENGTVVTINGSFDIVHVGHIYTIKQAKKQGDLLIVGLNSDKSIRSYKNGQGPIFNQSARAYLLSAIEDVDNIVYFDEPNPIKFLEAIRPDIHCNAASYGQDCVEAKTVKKNGGKLYLIPDNMSDDKMTYSTSNVIEQIIEHYKDKIKVVFLDRDGVVNVDTGYTHKIKDLQLTKNCIKGLNEFKGLGYKFIIITNQSGIARKYFQEEHMHEFNDALLALLMKGGIKIEKVYYCPHHPDLTGDCDCRKPRHGLFSKAKKEFNIDMLGSISIGDKDSDTIAAKNSGVGTIISIRGRYEQKAKSDYFADDLLDASEYILKQERRL